MILGIIFGAKSYEHEISIVSSVVLSKVLSDDLKFIFIDFNEDFYLIDKDDLKAIYFSSYAYKKSKKLFLDKDGFYYKSIFSKVYAKCDMFINLIHGAYGEEGTASAFLDFYNQSYIGPRIEASVVSYNKYMTKMYAACVGVGVLDYEIINKNQSIKTSLDFPLIVKPCRGGSSMGVSVVKTNQEFEYYLQEAFEYDDEVILEPYIKDVKEYNLAGYKTSDVIYSNIEEPKKGDILDFDTKYMDFSRDEKISQADISKKLEQNLQEAFCKIYANIFKGSIIRCDFFVIDDRVYLNEINPIPGSMAHYLFDDFNNVINDMFYSLPTKRDIHSGYNYIHNINKSKG